MSYTPDFLLNGYRRFYNKYFLDKKLLYRNLAKYGQSPKALVVACSDSRVDPSILLDCTPGDLFVVRNVANLIPPYEPDSGHHGTSSALEFGIRVLRIPHLIVLGHTQCGGIQNLMKEEVATTDHSFVRHWMSIAEQAKIKACIQDQKSGDIMEACGRYAILHSLQNALSFPWIQELVQAKKLTLNAWNFNLQTGELEIFDATSNAFVSSQTVV